MSEIAVIRLASLKMMMRFLKNRGRTLMHSTRPRFSGLQIEADAEGGISIMASDIIRLGVLHENTAIIDPGRSYFLPYSRQLAGIFSEVRRPGDDAFAVLDFDQKTLTPYFTRDAVSKKAEKKKIAWGQAALKFVGSVSQQAPSISFDSKTYRNALEIGPLEWRSLMPSVLLPADTPLPAFDPDYVRSFEFISPHRGRNTNWDIRVGKIPRHDAPVISMRTPEVPQFSGILAPIDNSKPG